jgi:hypothetical protein
VEIALTEGTVGIGAIEATEATEVREAIEDTEATEVIVDFEGTVGVDEDVEAFKTATDEVLPLVDQNHRIVGDHLLHLVGSIPMFLLTVVLVVADEVMMILPTGDQDLEQSHDRGQDPRHQLHVVDVIAPHQKIGQLCLDLLRHFLGGSMFVEDGTPAPRVVQDLFHPHHDTKTTQHVLRVRGQDLPIDGKDVLEVDLAQ